MTVEIDLSKYGWRKGGYLFKCHDCGKEMCSGAKRCLRCRDCAMDRYEKDKIREERRDPAAVKILQLIESVDVNDTETLDEIDARVACYEHGKEYVSHSINGVNNIDIITTDNRLLGFPRYTRSRDALKQIRPEGWHYHTVASRAEYKRSAMTNDNITAAAISERLPTEELAELHAIIQAMEWERGAYEGK